MERGNIQRGKDRDGESGRQTVKERLRKTENESSFHFMNNSWRRIDATREMKDWVEQGKEKSPGN